MVVAGGDVFTTGGEVRRALVFHEEAAGAESGNALQNETQDDHAHGESVEVAVELGMSIRDVAEAVTGDADQGRAGSLAEEASVEDFYKDIALDIARVVT